MKSLIRLRNFNIQDTRKDTGRNGEDRAAAFLQSHGYIILERNYRERGGEIDIIALCPAKNQKSILTECISTDETLVFVEVKALPNGTLETLSHELNAVKQQKILKTAKLYLQKHREYSNRYIRFDVLAVDVPGLEPVYHIANAFSE